MPSVRTLSRFLREAQAAVRLRGLVSVLLTTDTAIRRLNRTFRGKNKATDVLSFPAAKLSPVSKARPGAPARLLISGDLAISVEIARRQAVEQGHALSVELKVLMLHGLLHLAGYDHETDTGKMERRERVLRARLGLPSGLIERSSFPTLATEKNRKDGARKLIERSSLPTHSPKSRRMDGAPSFLGKAGGKTASGARSVSAKPARSIRPLARPKADRAKPAGGRA